MKELTKAGKEEFALALMLWKDFKKQGAMDLEIFKRMYEMADYIGCRQELDELNHKLLVPFEIKLKT